MITPLDKSFLNICVAVNCCSTESPYKACTISGVTILCNTQISPDNYTCVCYNWYVQHRNKKLLPASTCDLNTYLPLYQGRLMR